MSRYTQRHKQGQAEWSACYQKHDLVIAGNSQVHRNHLASTDDFDLCFAGLDIDEFPTYEMWVRDEADCLISGTNNGLVDCVDEVEFDPCGSEYVPPPE